MWDLINLTKRKGNQMKKLPLFLTKLTEKQARHKSFKPNQWYESYVCESCGKESVAIGHIQSKQWIIYAYKKCPVCEASKEKTSQNKIIEAAKERALKMLGGVL